MKLVEWFRKFPKFLKEVRLEVKKTTFPNRSEVTNTTIVVIIVVFIFGIYLWLVDLIVSSLLTYLFDWFR